ncbi:MAG: pseudouridine-5'-phosphate glycosidase, partial [Candidatus Cryosericum sp.]
MVRKAQRSDSEHLSGHKGVSGLAEGIAEGAAHMGTHPQEFAIAPEVQEALRKGKPVVALESAIITHG